MEYVINSEEINEIVKSETKYIRNWNIFLVISVILLLGIITYLCLSIPEDSAKTQGLWFKNYNASGVDQMTKSKESYGDWICINIDGMNFTEMQRVIQHEMAHEIFAEHCENNVSKCFEQIR